MDDRPTWTSRSGCWPRPTRRPHGWAWSRCGPGSRSEAEIAELVGRGLTNRQIATTAHISERTVETHVGHVLAKLGFTRRSEIAAWVAARPR